MRGRRAHPLLRWYLDYDHDNIPIDVYEVFRDEFMKEVIANPEGCTLPLNMGWVKIVGNQGPIENKPNRYNTGSDKTIYYNNFHTDGWIFKITWYSHPIGKTEDIVKKAFFNSEIYGFSPSKTFQRMLTASIRAGNWTHYHKKSFFRAPRTGRKVGRPSNASLVEAGNEALLKPQNDD